MKDPTKRTERSRQTRKGLVTLPRAVVLGVLVLAAFGAGVQFFSSARNSDGDADAAWTLDQPLPGAGVQDLSVEIAQPVVDLGRVALNTPAEGQWVLRNTGSGPISLGRPSIEVLEGC
ncbi:MAG: hypothetical protein M9925_00770 [Chloroflexi bacterium]|nr:hypothetical protein [Chloroflexota bacterium]MCZ7579103.1 hypothetical protein [Dehalococcoidia bacterium]